MLAGLTSREVAEWQAFALIEPFGEWRADLRAARVAAVVANCMGRREGAPAFAHDDFMTDFEALAARAVEGDDLDRAEAAAAEMAERARAVSGDHRNPGN